MPTRTSSKRHPLESIALLVGLSIAGAIVFTVIALLIAKAVYPDSDLQEALLGGDEASIGYLKIIQIFSTIGTFIVPALFFGWLEVGDPAYYLRLNRFPLILALFAILILFAAYPALDYSVAVNKKMGFPEGLRWLEDWMRQKEDEMTALTKQLLAVNTPGGLAVNLLMIAVLPAIGEEFFFRGCLQTTIWRGVKNYHAAIWITAFIFSAIHFQFYGFLPRMFLGALLGYLYVWGRSIWLPILAHFANNAASVIAAYVYQLKGESLDKLEEPQTTNLLIIFASMAIGAFLIWQYFKISHAQPIEEEYHEADGEQLG